jgi:hypothetical protein
MWLCGTAPFIHLLQILNNKMKKNILFLFIMATFAIALSAPVGPSSPVWSVESTTLKGDSVNSNVLLEDVNKDPKWSDMLSPPPLPIEKAISKAKSYARQFAPADYRLEVNDIKLKNIGNSHYVYVVEIMCVSSLGNPEGFTPPLNIVVLMNGKVIELTKHQGA